MVGARKFGYVLSLLLLGLVVPRQGYGSQSDPAHSVSSAQPQYHEVYRHVFHDPVFDQYCLPFSKVEGAQVLGIIAPSFGNIVVIVDPTPSFEGYFVGYGHLHFATHAIVSEGSTTEWGSIFSSTSSTIPGLGGTSTS